MSKTVDIEAMYQHLEDTVRGYNPSANFQQIRQAYEFARDLHGPQLRKDGSPFVTPLRIPRPPTSSWPSCFPPPSPIWWRASAS